MRRSPLHDLNDRLGARFVEFGGWEMPIQYESILAEHRAVRSSVGVFDVTHLGRFSLAGDGAHRAISRLLCNDIDRIEPGRCQYTMILNREGGIIDDLIVWWRGDDDYWLMPNAVNQDRVMEAFADQPGCAVNDLQGSTVLLAVQGPEAPSLIEEVAGLEPGRFRTVSGDTPHGPVTMAGTGYTGEPGGEICADPRTARALMEALVEAGATPCGLGARDTLRLEAGLTLWGQDIDETTTPLEAGLDFAVSLDHQFTGREKLVAQVEGRLARRLAGFVLEERGIPRHGHAARSVDGANGEVTSGNISPILGTGVGLAYLSPPVEVGDQIEVRIRERWTHGRIARPPFHVTG